MSIDKCSDKYKLPNLGFIFKGVQQNGKDSAFELILTPDDYVLEFEVDGKPDCVVGIGSDNEDSGWTLGQVFLKAYYTVFDRDTESIGFVKSNPNPFNPPNFNFGEKIQNMSVESIPNSNSMNNNLNNNIYTNNNNVVMIKDGAISGYTGAEIETTMFDPIEKKFLSLLKNAN